ncbi:MAG: hypothetical protein TREMPRED_001842, partial [Tremellales sp. Tagirdzhanova-0007]
MSSSAKRGRRSTYYSSSRLSEPALPLHIALAWLSIKVFRLNTDREPVPIFSPTFVSSILKVIAREVFELSATPATYADLLTETDLLIRPEIANIAKANDKLRSR